jgi:carboxypeptidase PM20D1
MIYLLSFSFLVLLFVVVSRTAFHSRRHKFDDGFENINVPIDDAVQRLSKAIQFETISNQNPDDIQGDEFTRMHNYLKNEFPLVHSQLKKEIVNHYSLLYTWEGKRQDLKPIMLTCHLDVVPVEPGTENDWTHPPFQGKITDTHIYGRGTMDVQSGVLGILEATELLLERGYEPDRTIYLAFGHDEEIDGEFGAQEIGNILKSRGVELEFLLDEGLPVVEQLFTGLKSPIAFVAVAEKGYLSLELTCEANGGHSSIPQGKTSIAQLSSAIHKLEENRMPAKVDKLVKSSLVGMIPGLSYPFRFVFANIWIFQLALKRILTGRPETDATLRTTTATTIFESGMKENLIPTMARAVVNFRIHPNDTVEDVIRHVENTINDRNIRITKLNGYINPSAISSPANPNYMKLADTIRQVFPGVSVSPSLMIGATDARHYSDLTENVYRFFPLRANQDDLDRVHGTNERILISNYVEIIQFYARFILNTASLVPVKKINENTIFFSKVKVEQILEEQAIAV